MSIARANAVGVQADSLSLVSFDRYQYSVPTQYAHRHVTIVAGIDEVRIVFGDRLIAQRLSSWDRGQCLSDLDVVELPERRISDALNEASYICDARGEDRVTYDLMRDRRAEQSSCAFRRAAD